MRYFYILLPFILFSQKGLAESSYQLVWMNSAVISSLQVTSGADKARYSLRTDGNWTPYSSYLDKAADCANPTYATISSDQHGAESLLSVALTARATGQPVVLVGVCGYHEAYFEIQRIIY